MADSGIARPRDAAPIDIVREGGPVGLVKQVGRQVMRDDVLGLAAEIAYRFFLALFPFFIFLAALSGFVAAWIGIRDPAQRAIEAMGSLLPPEAATLIAGQLTAVLGNQEAGALSLGALGALYAASGGISAVMKATNRAFEVEESRPIWKRYGIAIALTLFGSAALIAAVALLVPVQVVGAQIAEQLGLPAFVVGLAAIAGAVVLVLIATVLVYRFAPAIDLPFRWLLPGALFFVVAWLLATFALGFYVSNFATYNATYGALAGVVILLLWFYVTGVVLLAGAEINQVLATRGNTTELQSRRDAANERAARSKESKESKEAKGARVERPPASGPSVTSAPPPAEPTRVAAPAPPGTAPAFRQAVVVIPASPLRPAIPARGRRRRGSAATITLAVAQRAMRAATLGLRLLLRRVVRAVRRTVRRAG